MKSTFIVIGYLILVGMVCKQQQNLIEQIPAIIEKELSISDFYLMFQPLKVNKIEIKSLFKFVDINKDDRVSILEWENFYSLFLKQYISCDSNSDFQISLDEFQSCEDLQKSFQKYSIDSDQIYKVFGKKETQNMNLNDYLYVRRMIYAWQQCSNNSEIPLSQISCGIEIVAPTTSEYLNYAIDLFHQLQKLRFGMLVESKAIHINVIDFFLLSYLYSQFENYEYPCSEGILQKKEMMLSIELGKVPDYMDRKMVELMFNEKESIDFNDFSIFFYVQILFNRFSTDKLIKFDSFIQMLQDEFFPVQISKSIENVVLPTQESIDQLTADKQLNHLLTVDSFFSSFFQKNSKFKKYHQKHKQENELQKMGQIIFNIFKSDVLEGFRFQEFYHFYRFSIVFIIIDENKIY